MAEIEGKICNSCRLWKPYTEYTDYEKVNKFGDKITYYYSKCKTCTNASYRANYVRTKTPKRKKVDYRKIGKVQQEAAEHGMSYGQWVAQQYMKDQKEKKKHDI